MFGLSAISYSTCHQLVGAVNETLHNPSSAPFIAVVRQPTNFHLLGVIRVSELWYIGMPVEWNIEHKYTDDNRKNKGERYFNENQKK